MTADNDYYIGRTVYCKLTGKPMMIQEIRYTTGDNPQYVTNEKIIESLLVRYLSVKHDEFKNTEVKSFEVSLEPIYKDNNNGKK